MFIIIINFIMVYSILQYKIDRGIRLQDIFSINLHFKTSWQPSH